MVFQQEDGQLEWMGRYALVMPHQGVKSILKAFKKDNAADVDTSFRKESKHLFFVR